MGTCRVGSTWRGKGLVRGYAIVFRHSEFHDSVRGLNLEMIITSPLHNVNCLPSIAQLVEWRTAGVCILHNSCCKVTNFRPVLIFIRLT